jgi:hypothetical protein
MSKSPQVDEWNVNDLEDDYPGMLGIEPDEDHLMWIAKESFDNFINNWTVCKDVNGKFSHFYNPKTGMESQEVPIDPKYTRKVEEERRKHMNKIRLRPEKQEHNYIKSHEKDSMKNRGIYQSVQIDNFDEYGTTVI